MPLLQVAAFLPFIDSCVPKIHMFSHLVGRHNPPGRLRSGLLRNKKRKIRRKDELSSKFETISRHGEDMEETRRMSTAAQRQHIRQHRWNLVSGSQRARDSGQLEGGWGSEEEYAKGRARGGKGTTAPKHPCMNAHSLARFPHLPGETRVRFTSSLLPPSRERERETPHDSRVPPALLLLSSVIMCSHIGVPERSTEGGRGGGGERNIGNGAEYEGGGVR